MVDIEKQGIYLKYPEKIGSIPFNLYEFSKIPFLPFNPELVLNFRLISSEISCLDQPIKFLYTTNDGQILKFELSEDFLEGDWVGKSLVDFLFIKRNSKYSRYLHIEILSGQEMQGTLEMTNSNFGAWEIKEKIRVDSTIKSELIVVDLLKNLDFLKLCLGFQSPKYNSYIIESNNIKGYDYVIGTIHSSALAYTNFEYTFGNCINNLRYKPNSLQGKYRFFYR